MKKSLSFAFFLILATILLPLHAFSAQKDKKVLVATSFYEFDWLSQIIKGKEDNFSVKLLIDNGIDVHNYQPSVKDVAMISAADLFIYNGGISDAWAKDIAENAQNPKLIAFNVMQSLGNKVKTEAMVEGMQTTARRHGHKEHGHVEEDVHDSHEGHNHAAHEHCDHDHTYDMHADEHIWLSLKNAAYVCEKLGRVLSIIDPRNKKIYEENAKAYIKRLKALDKEYAKAVNNSPRKPLIFADRFPFLYMMKDYGIDYFAAFQGCSAETEASFNTVLFLSKKVDELDAGSVLIIDGGMEELAKTVINNTKKQKAKILTLNSLQSVSKKEIEEKATYLSLMQDNLLVLKQALQ